MKFPGNFHCDLHGSRYLVIVTDNPFMTKFPFVFLGMPRMDNGAPQPADLIISRSHPTTVITSVPSSPRKSQPKVKKPNIAVMHMKSEKKEPVKLTVQVRCILYCAATMLYSSEDSKACVEEKPTSTDFPNAHLNIVKCEVMRRMLKMVGCEES